MPHSTELASPKQTALGVNTPRCDEDSLELKELMVFFVPICVEKDGVGVNAGDLQSKLLTKPIESEGFEQIINFLNRSSVRYALTASPTIRTSCIKQFCSTDNIKTVNDEVRVHALIDAKRVNIKESFIHRTLKLDDEGCLSAKTTSWNDFSSTMASAIICLATNQKFNFLRYILLSLVKNIEARIPLYMFLRELVLVFLWVITPLFENILVLANEELGQAQDDVSIPTEPSTSKPHKKHKSKKQQPIAPKIPSPEPSPEHQLPSPSNDPIPTTKDSVKLQELIDFYTRLSNKVLDLESEVIDIKSYFTDKIEKLEDKVHKLEEENRILKEKSFKIRYTKHSEKVLSMHDIDAEEAAEVEEVLEVVTTAKFITEVVTTAEPTTTAAQVPKSKDKGKGILIEEPKPLKGQAQIKQDEVFARQLEAELNANINWNDVMEQVKTSKRQNNAVMRYQALKRKPLTEAQARKNMMIYLKNMHEIAKKHRIDEEAEELKGHLQIMSNDDDDVYTEATPLASKVHVVDYQIHHENNKPYYKIIRADGSHKLFLSFITLLKNFDREDLDTLWKLVKERFETTEPKNFSDDFLLNILKIMFEKPNIKANVWKDQKDRYGLAKVKSWKLFESCGFHIITFTTTQMFLLVKKYPLTHFTLE
nr:hypothetical protein [Tanacetum cinerariifolium]